MATRAALNTIKANLKTLFDSANTMTASPIDLSSDLTRRVQKVLTVHPVMIPIQASHYPYVTSYIAEKPIEGDQIAKDQLNPKRKSKVQIDVVGGVWNQNVTDVTKDNADSDINYLMESIELILRSDPTLSNAVSWQIPRNCQYYSNMVDSNSHIRIGILRVEAMIFY